MFKNVPHFKTKGGNKNARETFVNSLEIISFSFLLIIINKLLRKSLFHLFWHWFLTLSFLHRKLAIQVCFCKVAGENGKKILPETFLSYQKGISPMDAFIILQLSRIRLCRKWFSGENKERKTTLQETQAD